MRHSLFPYYYAVDIHSVFECHLHNMCLLDPLTLQIIPCIFSTMRFIITHPSKGWSENFIHIYKNRLLKIRDHFMSFNMTEMGIPNSQAKLAWTVSISEWGNVWVVWIEMREWKGREGTCLSLWYMIQHVFALKYHRITCYAGEAKSVSFIL